MPPVGPVKRSELVACFRALGFVGPYAGAKHEFMKRGEQKIRLPNPHQGDISGGLLRRILRDAGIGREEWESLP